MGNRTALSLPLLISPLPGRGGRGARTSSSSTRAARVASRATSRSTAQGSRSSPTTLQPGAILALAPDGVLVSNGPGDPEPFIDTIRTIRDLLEARIPWRASASGTSSRAGSRRRTYKMRFGHRRANHPIKDMRTGGIVITTQNHGFAVDPEPGHRLGAA